ncbi:MAG: TetR/AcrR family transcriptional regulator [Cyclobacteriaceae bacterium]
MEDIQSRILLKANELFMRYGFRSVSMDDIAREMGVSKKTIYQYYPEKEELVRAIFRQHQQQWLKNSERIKATSTNAIEEILFYTDLVRQQVSTINPSLLFDLYKYHRSVWDEWSQYKANIARKSVIDTLERGIREGYFRADLDPVIIAVMRMEQIEMAFNDQLFPSAGFSVKKVHAQLFDHFISGLLTEKGRVLYQSMNHILKSE